MGLGDKIHADGANDGKNLEPSLIEKEAIGEEVALYEHADVSHKDQHQHFQ